MTLHQFRSLPADEQRTLIQLFGVFLLKRHAVNVTAKLYQLEGFYCEIFFDQRTSEVIRIISFDDTHKLEPYLRLVNVSELQPFL